MGSDRRRLCKRRKRRVERQRVTEALEINGPYQLWGKTWDEVDNPEEM